MKPATLISFTQRVERYGRASDSSLSSVCVCVCVCVCVGYGLGGGR